MSDFKPKDIKLIIDTEEFPFWKQLSVDRSLDMSASTFTATITEPGNFPMKENAEVLVKYKNKKLFTGWLEDIEDDDSASSVGFNIGGRSKTADAIDCSTFTDKWQWKNINLQTLGKEFLDPYEISFVSEIDPIKIKKHALELGETPFDGISRVIRSKNTFLTDNAEGHLVLTRLKNKRTETVLLRGVNTLSARVHMSAAERYSSYNCFGQRSGDSANFAKSVCQSKGSAFDKTIKRNRVLIIKAEGNADDERCKMRAAWECAVRKGESTQIDVTVSGWTQDNGELWDTNLITHFKDERREIDDDFVVSSVGYSASESEITCNLTLKPQSAYLLEPSPIEDKAAQTGNWKDKR